MTQNNSYFEVFFLINGTSLLPKSHAPARARARAHLQCKQRKSLQRPRPGCSSGVRRRGSGPGKLAVCSSLCLADAFMASRCHQIIAFSLRPRRVFRSGSSLLPLSHCRPPLSFHFLLCRGMPASRQLFSHAVNESLRGFQGRRHGNLALLRFSSDLTY